MIVQIILVFAACVLMWMGLMNRNAHSGKAWKKIALALLAFLMIIAVIFPSLVTDLAHLLGVGRGADLLLYALVVAFFFYVLNNYLAQQDQRTILYRLARRVAINEAKARQRRKP